MKNLRTITFMLAFVCAIASAYASTAIFDAPVRGVIGGICQQIDQCTTQIRVMAICPIATDNNNYYSLLDTNCTTPLTVLVRFRVSQ